MPIPYRISVITGALLVGFSLTAHAQIAPVKSGTLAMTNWDTKTGLLPANTASTLFNFTIESGTAGKDVIDVNCASAQAVVSLVTPGGVEITAANATSLGYTFTTVAAGTQDDDDIISPMTLPGTHTVIEFPTPASPGVYKIKANTTGVSSATSLMAVYFSSSQVRLGAAANAMEYKVGDTVVLSGVLRDDNIAVNGATLTASISAPLDISQQVSIGPYQLVSQQAADADDTDFTYTAQLTNSGPARTSIVATLNVDDPSLEIIDGALIFGPVAANGTVTSTNSFTIRRATNSALVPSLLKWQPVATGTATSVSLVDGGPFDNSTGDGVYTGTFTPSLPGDYSAVVTATGTAASGQAFSRTSSALFRVSPAMASFLSFTNTPIDYNGIGVANKVRVTASIAVQQAGKYRFGISMDDGTGALKSMGYATAVLTTGTQTLSIDWTPKAAVDNFQYVLRNAMLERLDLPEEVMAAYVENPGTLAPYVYAKAPLALSGSYTAVGVDDNGIPGFEILRINVGITPSRQGHCVWSGTLATLSGTLIERLSREGLFASPVGSISFDFNGYNLRRQNQGGPYTLRNVEISCWPDTAKLQGIAFTTGTFQATQFEAGTAGFTIAVDSAVSVQAGSRYSFYGEIARLAGFDGKICFALTGQPANFDTRIFGPCIFDSPRTSVMLTAPANATTGSYPMVLTATGGAITQTYPINLTVRSAIADVSSQVSVAKSGLLCGPSTQDGTILITNTGIQIIPAPLQIVLANIPAGLTLANLTAITSGNPYITVNRSLFPGQSVVVPVRFTGSASLTSTTTITTYSGTF